MEIIGTVLIYMPYRLGIQSTGNSWLKVLLLGIFLAVQPVLAELYKVLSADTPAWPTEFQWYAFIVLAAIQFVTYFINFLQKE